MGVVLGGVGVRGGRYCKGLGMGVVCVVSNVDLEGTGSSAPLGSGPKTQDQRPRTKVLGLLD